MKHLYPYLRRFRKESILAPLFKMLEATFDLLVPMVVADIITIIIFRRSARWVHILKAVPWALTGIVIGWLDSALQVGPERAGPILAALAESGEGGEGVQLRASSAGDRTNDRVVARGARNVVQTLSEHNSQLLTNPFTHQRLTRVLKPSKRPLPTTFLPQKAYFQS